MLYLALGMSFLHEQAMEQEFFLQDGGASSPSQQMNLMRQFPPTLPPLPEMCLVLFR